MIRFIKWLFTGDAHLHEWEVYKKYTISDKKRNFITDALLTRCKHCGKMKKFELA